MNYKTPQMTVKFMNSLGQPPSGKDNEPSVEDREHQVASTYSNTASEKMEQDVNEALSNASDSLSSDPSSSEYHVLQEILKNTKEESEERLVYSILEKERAEGRLSELETALEQERSKEQKDLDEDFVKSIVDEVSISLKNGALIKTSSHLTVELSCFFECRFKAFHLRL